MRRSGTTRARPTPAPPHRRPRTSAPPGSWSAAPRTGTPRGPGLHDRHVDVVFRPLSHEVGDLTSETSVRGLRRIDPPDHQGRDVGAWLVTIAGNLPSLLGAPVVPGVSLWLPR